MDINENQLHNVENTSTPLLAGESKMLLRG